MGPEAGALASAFVVSAASLVGIAVLPSDDARIRRLTPILLALACGALLGDALLHLLPEAFARAGSVFAPGAVFALAFAGFLAVDVALRARLRGAPPVRVVGYLNLAADAVHNLVDGMAIAVSWAVGPELGVATALAVLAHEVPAELGDYGILLYAGFSRARAIALNMACALSAVLGVLLVVAFGVGVDALARIALPLTAGGFVYVSAVHLLPGVLRQRDLASLAALAAGVAFMVALRLVR
jgi:zinc and cadmium transporter